MFMTSQLTFLATLKNAMAIMTITLLSYAVHPEIALAQESNTGQQTNFESVMADRIAKIESDMADRIAQIESVMADRIAKNEAKVDHIYWEGIEDKSRGSFYEDYLNYFPDGIYQATAKERLAESKRRHKIVGFIMASFLALASCVLIWILCSVTRNNPVRE